MNLVTIEIHDHSPKTFTAIVKVPTNRYSLLVDVDNFADVIRSKLRIKHKVSLMRDDKRVMEFILGRDKVRALVELVKIAFPDAQLKWMLEN